MQLNSSTNFFSRSDIDSTKDLVGDPPSSSGGVFSPKRRQASLFSAGVRREQEASSPEPGATPHGGLTLHRF